MPQLRPNFYPDLDINLTNSTALPLAESLNGYPNGAALPAADYNALQGETGRWVRWLDQRAVIVPEISADGLCITLGTGVSYPTGTGSLTTVANGEGMYLWRGVRLDLLTNKLPLYGLDSVTWVANRDNYVFIDDDYGVTFLDVPVADPPPATPANAFLLGYARTDGVEVTLWVPGSAPQVLLLRQVLRAQKNGSRGHFELQGDGLGTPGELRGLASNDAVLGRLRSVDSVGAGTLKMWLDGGTGFTPAMGWDESNVVTTLNQDCVAPQAGGRVRRRLRGQVEAVGTDLDVSAATSANFVEESTDHAQFAAGNSSTQVRISPVLGLTNDRVMSGTVWVDVVATADVSRKAHFLLYIAAENKGGVISFETVTIVSKFTPFPEYASISFALSNTGDNIDLVITTNDVLAPAGRMFASWRLNHVEP